MSQSKVTRISRRNVLKNFTKWISFGNPFVKSAQTHKTKMCHLAEWISRQMFNSFERGFSCWKDTDVRYVFQKKIHQLLLVMVRRRRKTDQVSYSWVSGNRLECEYLEHRTFFWKSAWIAHLEIKCTSCGMHCHAGQMQEKSHKKLFGSIFWP